MKKSLLFFICVIMTMAWSLPVSAQQRAVVRTMAHDHLTPLPSYPGAFQPTVSKSPVRQHRVPVVAADYKMPAQLYGLMVYSTRWAGGSGKGNYGVYRFTADKPNTMTAVVKDDAFAASGGAIYANGRLDVLNYTSLWGTIILDYDRYQYSTQYWDLLQHDHQDDVTRLMSSTGAYDPATGKCYAVMYTEDMNHQVLGTLDYDQNSRQVIRQLPDAENIAAMAISPEGIVYAVRFDGKLVKVNKQTGSQTVIGATGITPQYLQSAAIDPRTGRMFWAACSVEDPVGLYEVDLATGAATLIQKFNNSEEFVGLYIPLPPAAEEAPAAPTTLSARFTNDELQGALSFRLPSKTYAGDDLTADSVGYRVYIDSVLAVQAYGQPGATVKPEVSVPESRTYRFEVCAFNDYGESPRVHVDKFVGRDRPTAPTSVKLARTVAEDVLKLTWNAPSKGVHGGYVNKSELNYSVLRMPDSIVVAEQLTERIVTDTVQTEHLTKYYYVVTAFNGELQGEAAESNRILLGTTVEPPFFDDFEDLSVISNMYTFVDANKDGTTWKSGFWNGTQNSDVYYQYNEDQKTAADDWLISPPVHLKANRFYAVSFDLNAYFIGTEKMSAWMGNDKTVAAMTNKILDTQVIDYTQPRTFTEVFKNDEDAIRYFGFHAESDADQGILEFDNLRIEERGVFEAPDTVTNFTVTPAAAGVLRAKVTFCAPVQDFFGQPISQIDRIDVYRDEQLIKTFENPAPGDTITLDEKQLPNCEITWTVYTYNSYGCGIPAVRKAWVGTDIPTEPTDVTLTMSGTTARLSWKAPTTGVHGGYIRPSVLTYNIEDMNFYIKGDHRSGTTYSENRGAKQEFLSYRVSAQSTAGGGNYAYSNTVISGTPYALPFRESFANAATEQLWSQQLTGGQIGLTNSISADGDQGCAIYKPGANGDVGMITSGKINVKKAAYPVLEFYYYALPGQQTTLTVAIVPDGDSDRLQALQVIDYSKLSGMEGWRKVACQLEGYQDCNHILLSFIGRATGRSFGDIAFDAITVREQDDVDMAVQSLVLKPSVVEAGAVTQAVATLYNNGRLEASGYVVRVKKNGELTDDVEGPELAPGASAEVVFDLPTTVFDEATNTIEVSVFAGGDANAANDAAQAVLTVEEPLFPAPTAVTASVGAGASLQWAAPDLTPRNVMVGDDFERYQPFIIDGIGRWTVNDGDGQQTLAIQTSDRNTVMYDHVGEPMAYQVFNASKVGLEGVAALQSHSGDQMLINIIEAANAKADDWLISPRLQATEQTISFWVKSMDASAIETFQVLASQTDANPSSFVPVEASATQAPTAWTQVTATLPAGVAYFAVRVNAKQKFMLLLDDFQYALFNTANLHLLGYNVYIGQERVNAEPLASTSMPLAGWGNAQCVVTAVYQEGESAPSQPISLPDAVTAPYADEASPVGVFYDLQGRRLPGRPSKKGVYVGAGRKTLP